MAGTQSSINLIASAGILGNVGGVPISANANALTSISNYNSIGAVIQYGNVKITGNAVLSNVVVSSLSTLADSLFPSLTNVTPNAYVSTLGVAPLSGFSSFVSTDISNIMGNGDLGKFDQVFGQASSYVVLTNQLINSSINANNTVSNSTYTTQDNVATGGLSQITQAFVPFSEDFAALGSAISLLDLPNLGSPQALLKQIYTQTSGSAELNNALLAAGIDQSALTNIDTSPMTDEQQKIAFNVMQQITGGPLVQILTLLKVTTRGFVNLSELLNPVKLFPKSFNTLTAPTSNGLRAIYINDSGAVNFNLETELPSPVLAPLYGYQTVKNTYSQLKNIIPPDWALANKALQAGLQQVKSIFNTTPSLMSVATAQLESNKGLNLINALTSPLPTNVSEYYASTFSQGTGLNGTVLLSDVIGSAAGYNVTNNFSTVTSVLSSMTSAGTLNTLTNATGVYTVMQNVIDGVYGDIANAIVIPGGLPGAGSYADGNAAFTSGLIPAAYSLIGTIVTNNSSNVANANSSWSNVAAQLALEKSTQVSAGINFATLLSGTQALSLAQSIPQYGLDTDVGGAAWFLESVANTSTQGGQAIISSMREARNQVRLQGAGLQTDIIVDDEIPQPQISLSSGQYSASAAAGQKII